MSDPRQLPPVPVADPESASFWAALSDGRLDMCRCTESECRRWLQPPLERCRWCAGPTAFEPVTGRGTVFSYIVVRHQAIPGFVPPYVVAMVQLDEQRDLRLTGVLDLDVERVTIGMAVRAHIREIGTSGVNGVYFRPDDN